jgi:hypothetical protein
MGWSGLAVAQLGCTISTLLIRSVKLSNHSGVLKSGIGGDWSRGCTILHAFGGLLQQQLGFGSTWCGLRMGRFCAFLRKSGGCEGASLFGHAASAVLCAGAYVGLWWLAEENRFRDPTIPMALRYADGTCTCIFEMSLWGDLGCFFLVPFGCFIADFGSW